MTEDISKKTLERIRTEDIRPEAGWKFTVRRALTWIGFAVTAALGALSLSIAVLPILAIDPHILSFGPRRLLSPAVIRLVPLLWIVFLAAFVAMAVAEFRNTKHGYRHRVTVVALGILLFIVAGAGALHALHVNERSDEAFRRGIPPYAGMRRGSDEFWTQEKEGFLAGTVLSGDLGEFELQDPGNRTWTVVTDDDTVVFPEAKVESGERVKIIGNLVDRNTFEAEEILPDTRPNLRPNHDEKDAERTGKRLRVDSERIRER
ncbi:MAG: hypothetical protein HGA38_04815 [Candidatus Moranbacteria bacterium]|nr:hypothetical protein [Candidatus Moranbacteria bacterium]